MRPVCALYVLERLLHVMTHARLVNLLAAALLLEGPPAAAQHHRPLMPARAGSPDTSRVSRRHALFPGALLSWCHGPGNFDSSFMQSSRQLACCLDPVH